ncbi:hypothetical protein HMPREF9720_1983 [Alistipes sp. HGB5]|nr:hypothetical protein HMPREF9720_1983 [Alistipes sp. HGB5]
MRPRIVKIGGPVFAAVSISGIGPADCFGNRNSGIRRIK